MSSNLFGCALLLITAPQPSVGWATGQSLRSRFGAARAGAAASAPSQAVPNLSVPQDAGGGSGILASARLWGVQILHVDRILLRTLGWGCWELGIFETGGAEGMAQDKEEI